MPTFKRRLCTALILCGLGFPAVSEAISVSDISVCKVGTGQALVGRVKLANTPDKFFTDQNNKYALCKDKQGRPLIIVQAIKQNNVAFIQVPESLMLTSTTGIHIRADSTNKPERTVKLAKSAKTACTIATVIPLFCMTGDHHVVENLILEGGIAIVNAGNDNAVFKSELTGGVIGLSLLTTSHQLIANKIFGILGQAIYFKEEPTSDVLENIFVCNHLTGGVEPFMLVMGGTPSDQYDTIYGNDAHYNDFSGSEAEKDAELQAANACYYDNVKKELSSFPDTDGDGTPDYKDQCPNHAASPKGGQCQCAKGYEENKTLDLCVKIGGDWGGDDGADGGGTAGDGGGTSGGSTSGGSTSGTTTGGSSGGSSTGGTSDGGTVDCKDDEILDSVANECVPNTDTDGDGIADAFDACINDHDPSNKCGQKKEEKKDDSKNVASPSSGGCSLTPGSDPREHTERGLVGLLLAIIVGAYYLWRRHPMSEDSEITSF